MERRHLRVRQVVDDWWTLHQLSLLLVPPPMMLLLLAAGLFCAIRPRLLLLLLLLVRPFVCCRSCRCSREGLPALPPRLNPHYIALQECAAGWVGLICSTSNVVPWRSDDEGIITALEMTERVARWLLAAEGGLKSMCNRPGSCHVSAERSRMLGAPDIALPPHDCRIRHKQGIQTITKLPALRIGATCWPPFFD